MLTTNIDPPRRVRWWPALVKAIVALWLIAAMAIPAVPVWAQSDSVSTTNETRALERKRIVTKKEDSTAKKVVIFPFTVVAFPFWLTGKGIEKGLLTVENENLVDKSRYYSDRLRQAGVVVLYGVGYDGAGLGAGVQWTPREGPVTPTVSGAVSVRLYQVYKFRLDFSRALRGRLAASADANYRNFPQEDFYGIGPDSKLEDRTDYKLEETIVSFAAHRSFPKKLRFHADVAYTNTNIFSGEDKRFPSTDDVFTPDEVPALDSGAQLVAAGLGLGYTGLDYEGDPWSGVFATVSFTWNEDTQGDAFDFWRTYVELKGYLPLLGGGNRFGPRSSLGVRVYADLNEARNGGAVPFFRMPRVGGSDTVRGFREFRFTDNNAAVFNMEYKYPIQRFLQAVIFWDEGQVFPTTSDFDFSNFRSSFGAGIRAAFQHSVVFRFEVAKSSEATRLIFKFGGGF